MTHKSKFSLEVGKYKSLIYNVWKKPSLKSRYLSVRFISQMAWMAGSSGIGYSTGANLYQDWMQKTAYITF